MLWYSSCILCARLLQVKEFYEKHGTGSGSRAVSQTLESIELNIHWVERNEQPCVEWLQRDGVIALPSDRMKRRAEEL